MENSISKTYKKKKELNYNMFIVAFLYVHNNTVIIYFHSNSYIQYLNIFHMKQ